MADTLVERVTGQATATAVPVEVGVVISDDSLLGEGDEPGEVTGSGPVPAPLVREWLRANTDPGREGCNSIVDGEARLAEAAVWLRRLYTRPADGALVGMDSRRRLFKGQLRHFLVIRDRICRTPWCGAPIRHLDHALAAAKGGETTAGNAQGLCEACSYAKEAPGWRTRLRDDGTVETTTPTGHNYESRPPPPVGSTDAA